MNTPMQNLISTYTSQMERLYQQIREAEDESAYWRFAFAFLLGYSKAGTGKDFESIDEYRNYIVEMYEQGVSVSMKRGSK